MKKILLPTDFTKDSEKAYAIAADLAKKHGASITIYNLIPAWSKGILNYLIYGGSEFVDDIDDIQIQESISNTRRLMERAIFEGITLEKEIKMLSPSDLKEYLIKDANTDEFDLVVIGHSTVYEKMISFSENLSQKLITPIIITNTYVSHFDPTSVLVCTDLEHLNAGFFKRIDQLNTASINKTILFLNTKSNFLTNEEIEKKLTTIKNKYHLKNVSFKWYNSDDITKSILNESISDHYDAIAIATHGTTGIKKLFSNSIAEEIIAISKLPVFSYNLHDHLEEASGIRTRTGFTG